MALTRPLPANIVASMRKQLRDSLTAGDSVDEQSRRINESIYKDFLDALAQLKGDPNYQIWFTANAPVAALDSTVTLDATSQQILPQRTSRQYLFMANMGANPMRVSFGKSVTATTGLVFPANAFYEPARPISSSVNMLSVLGTSAVVIEG